MKGFARSVQWIAFTLLAIGCAQQRQSVATDRNYPPAGQGSAQSSDSSADVHASLKPTGPGSPPQDPASNLATVRRIVDQAIQFVEQTPQYTCRVTRQETVAGRQFPREQMLMHFRRQPRSIYYKWLDDANSGRECVYVEGRNDGKVVTLGGKGDFLLAGRRVAVDPEGMLARSKSRYPISQSGLDRTIGRLDVVVKLLEKQDSSRGQVKYVGTVQRPESAQRLHEIVHQIPPGADPGFPAGATRHWYFEETGQLRLMFAEDPLNRLLEYYHFDRLVPNAGLTDDHFNPDVLWPNKGGDDKKQMKTAEIDGTLPK